uniref:Uncharacterized protein n=1 Tax=Arundo donax TaxID=35708 RepID=A0A0A9A7Z0_ARUDO
MDMVKTRLIGISQQYNLFRKVLWPLVTGRTIWSMKGEGQALKELGQIYTHFKPKYN